ncbi:MAG: hypothetical protein C0412_16300 [Flavobacterium sp.]|nr:hypothetical protein [Flavobacterium sp.]
MGNKNTMTILVCGFISAIFLCSFLKIGITFSLFLIFISIILFLFRKFSVSDVGSHPSQIKSQFEPSEIKNTFHRSGETRQKILFIIIFLFSFSVGIIRYEIKDSELLDINLENNVGNEVKISAVISDEPNRKEKQAILTVNLKNIVISSSTVSVKGKGIVSTDLYPELKYGDLINIKGKLEKPENFFNSNNNTTTINDPSQMKNQFDGTSFDYVSYLAKGDIYYKIDFAKTELISSGHGNTIKNFLFEIKNSFVNNIEETISAPESSLLSGILLGAKSSIDENTTEIFRKSGLSHIVALSGYNITIVADAIMKTLSSLPHTAGFTGGILGIILFVIMAGASSTAVRAGVMALIVILAQVTRRNYQAGRALIVAGLLMVIINPKILVFDVSFQLSFLATIAIIYVAPILKNKFTIIPEKFGLRDIVASTVSAQILVLPLILYKMGLLSLVALPANILVLVFMPAIMLFGFITGVLGFIWLPLSLPFAWISWTILAYIITVSEFFANLPFSSVNISWFSAGIMTFCYIIIAIWIIQKHRKNYPAVKFNEQNTKHV